MRYRAYKTFDDLSTFQHGVILFNGRKYMKTTLEPEDIQAIIEKMVTWYNPCMGIKWAYTFINVQLARLYNATLDRQSTVGII